MNKKIKDELKKCSIANIPNFTDDTTELIIKKYVKLELEVGKCYIIELKDFILNPASNSTLAINWNNGLIPTCKYYKCEVSTKLANMFKITGLEYDYINKKDLDKIWIGWLPSDGIKILERI